MEYIDDITRKAVLFDTAISDSDNPNSLFYHYMYAYTDVFGRPALLKLQVEELIGYGSYSTNTYDVFRDYKLNSIKEATISLSNRFSRPNLAENAASSISVSDLYSLVKTYDKDFHAGKPVNPVLLDTEISDKHGNKHPNTVFMHKMYAPITYNGQLYIAKINVEEYFENEKENRRVYQLTGIKIESASKGFDGNAALSHVADTDSMNTVADLFELVKTYDKDFHPKPVNPVFLNEDGTPKVVFKEEEYNAFLNVGKGKNDSKYHLYDITEKIRDNAHRLNGVGRLREFRPGNIVSADMISESPENVNTQIESENYALPENINVENAGDDRAKVAKEIANRTLGKKVYTKADAAECSIGKKTKPYSS